MLLIFFCGYCIIFVSGYCCGGKKQYDLSIFAAAVPGGRDIYAGEIFSLAQKLQSQIQLEALQDTLYRGVYCGGTVAAAGIRPSQKCLCGSCKANIDLLDGRSNVQRDCSRGV